MRNIRSLNINILAGLLLSFFFASAAHAQEIQPPNTILVSVDDYVIQSGDTLYRIGRRHCSAVSTIMELNNFKDYDVLEPGSTLYLPVNYCNTNGGSVYKPIKNELALSAEEKRDRELSDAESARAYQEAIDNQTYSGGIEEFTSGKNCSRANAQELDENGENYFDCVASRDSKQRDESAAADAARKNQKVHTEAPSGFAAFINNKDVQRSLTDSINSVNEQKIEDAKVRKRTADDEYRRRVRAGELKPDNNTYVASKAQQEQWDRDAVEAKRKTDAWMWQLEEDARLKAEATAKERRDQQKIKRANLRGAKSQRSLTLTTSGSNTSESGSNRSTSGTTRVYQLGACGNEPTVWASSVKPAVRGKNVGVFKVYHVVQPYDQWGRFDFGLGEVDETQCYYEYEIENEDMPSEYYPDGPYYEIGSKLFFFISKQHVRDHQPAKVNEKGTSYYFDDKLAACQKANIDIDYNFPAQVRDKPNFMKKGWGFELKFVENHAKHCGDI